MTEPDVDEIAKLVEQLDESTLKALLIELAGDHEAVRERLERLRLSAQPRKLAAAFRATLNGWRRSSRYLDYRQSHAFAAELESWLHQVERELLPRDPQLALELFEALIGSDASFFERADDSDGCIADAIRTACRLWLTTAARCEPPPAGWIERLRQLVRADDYSAREPLLRRCQPAVGRATDACACGAVRGRSRRQRSSRRRGPSLAALRVHGLRFAATAVRGAA